MPTTGTAEVSRSTRVLVFAVDDGSLCVDIDRVDTVYARSEARLHTLKNADALSCSFLIHRGEPALIVDLREAFGLSEILGLTDRATFIVLRAGSVPLALAADACVGIRDLDLRTKTPVPSALERDGGVSVGHLVELDGRVHTLLEPSRILSSALRQRLSPFLQEAQAFCKREEEISALTLKLKAETVFSDLKAYARLTRRNGRTRAAAAARMVLKAAQDGNQQAHDRGAVGGELAADTLLRDLLALSVARQTGEVELTLPGGATAALCFAAGRIADAQIAGALGRAAVRQILALHNGAYQFVASDIPVYPQRIQDAAPWLLVETIEQMAEARRSRHAR
jgi:chemotaxis signal transduction protein